MNATNKTTVKLDRATGITFEAGQDDGAIVLSVQKFGATLASMGLTVETLDLVIAAATEARAHAGAAS